MHVVLVLAKAVADHKATLVEIISTMPTMTWPVTPPGNGK